MILAPASRWVVIGNSGSGKSTLAKRVGTALHLPIFDLDLIHWHRDGRKRDAAEAKARVAALARADAWVIEGVYGWLAEGVATRATALVWLDLPWDECRDGLLVRGLRRGMTPGDQDALLTWASDYWTRTTSSSFAGHHHIFQSFAGAKTRLQTRADASTFTPLAGAWTVRPRGCDLP